jgi:hypothetical protein
VSALCATAAKYQRLPGPLGRSVLVLLNMPAPGGVSILATAGGCRAPARDATTWACGTEFRFALSVLSRAVELHPAFSAADTPRSIAGYRRRCRSTPPLPPLAVELP